jgi:CHAT domain-containing protein
MMFIDPSALYRKAFKAIRNQQFAGMELEANEQRKQARENLEEIQRAKTQVIDEEVMQEATRTRLRVADAVKKRLDFRLVGWMPWGATAGERSFEKVDPLEDIERNVRKVEEKYVVDPLRLKADFESTASEAAADTVVQTRSALSEQGFHAYLANTER